MYLIDTNVISELRKKGNINSGVKDFFTQAAVNGTPMYISVVTIGELRRGIELMRHRGDVSQSQALELWLNLILDEYDEHILEFSQETAQVWGALRVPHHENAIDKQIAATALVYDLCVVTRNIDDFKTTGVKTINPFS
ncbi:VapC toxin family PIN domain ribonuclease [Cellvibrio mixtus]|uniref:VapC toxin family PIN domain ribonuclease n=1 Tax=Cellvibrio mixtus TaxID=39650 RepID=A0A266Q314_9GAMM|nr:type II toxin-antitoxin system VapC family toxin [Cellvibrio mixtus]OZY84258.1 VapC toxin family PIN domain ribonuclease [Cellvibrio mixtus]